MNQPFLSSTLRELQLFTRSWRFWTTFALVVLLFVVTGPYGTFERMTLGIRLGYWLIVHAVTWSIAICFALMAEILLRRHLNHTLARMTIGSLVAALPIGFALGAIDFAFFGHWTNMGNGFHRALFALPLCALFCLLTYMAMHRQIAEVSASALPPASALAPAASEPEILTRLKPQNRGAILRLSVEDHYTDVVTSRGHELILLRFADALKELGATPGLQVHRSHWVADAHVERLKRDGGRLVLVMKDGTEIPVSRTYADAVRARFDELPARS
ncbi:LytTR family DNA-binding domain-containing protein [Neorhizobium galegae]|uniref:LytTR family DNA-binding domain-containing protein n=1 Tax=Neorhizobium galegae TaxID=399 RepID=UPI00062252E1|nr:LytTR family DNA-binding domain-containing protein [Neorhizobium galegae]CDZ25366.1 Response regulator of the LytR/AlgR family [Neorhizobium galegae bv. officinalis]KAA9387775.1 LytTR family transcriptional regulator [Neorhizobium galegae]KAB1115755.1 LytTR family transcriptional regulator [Neorhizobium galegae]MCM2498308.1 LytTR family transcriptional regulator [Neorhizobium galegae]MCQ1774277.1 LytTR family transcriptional regulator [Neorhizobium galegae]